MPNPARTDPPAAGRDARGTPLDLARREPAAVLDPRGRRKAYRPMPPAERDAAIARGLSAYDRGAYYLAHEELEVAWMATANTGERERLGGLIKLAAAGVHAARGNPAGVATNLRGARERLRGAREAGADGGLNLPAILVAIDERLALADALPMIPRHPVPDPPTEVAGPPGRAGRPPLEVRPPAIFRRTIG